MSLRVVYRRRPPQPVNTEGMSCNLPSTIAPPCNPSSSAVVIFQKVWKKDNTKSSPFYNSTTIARILSGKPLHDRINDGAAVNRQNIVASAHPNCNVFESECESEWFLGKSTKQ